VLHETKPNRWLTARRLRAHGTILAVCLWSFYAWNLATPGLRDRNGNLKGTDFLHFYTLGAIADQHRGPELYDMNAQATLAAQRVPAAAGIRYLPMYPPQASLLFEPLSHLPYAWALAVWWLCSAAIYGVCCFFVWRACPNLRKYGGLVALLAIAFPAFFHLIAWGQTSALALACFTLMFFLLRARKEFLAGIALGCLFFKPQLGLAAVVVFLSIGAWKVLAGAAISAVVELSVGAFYYGLEPFRRWLDLMWHIRGVLPLVEPKLYETHSLRTFWSMLLPWDNLNDLALALFVLSSIAVLALTVFIWRRKESWLALRYSSLLFATVLVAPHLTVYDLVILAPGFLLLADWLIAHPANNSSNGLGTLLYLAYLLPLVGPFALWTHVQLSVVAMAGCVYIIWKMSDRVSV
jgi:alpha-1,2-mannosyltransferase